MPVATLISPARSDRFDPRWAELERWTLEACLLRAEGRHEEAGAVMKQRMPALVRDWTAHCDLSEAAVVDRLRRLFTDTQQAVARTLAQQRTISARLATPARSMPFTAPAPAQGPSPVGLRRHVALDDVAGMLDALAESEREARRALLWPAHHAAFPTAACA